MKKKTPAGPTVTASSHDNSQVTAFIEAGTFDASVHDNSKLELSVKQTAGPEFIQSSDSGTDWQKWGSIAAIVGVLLAGVALWAMFYLDKN